MARQVTSSGKQASTKEYNGVRVVTPGKRNDKRVGKVARFVFHPSERRIVGFTVKRPDLLLMFHRKDSFVALDGFHIEDGRVMINDDPESSGAAAIKRLNLDWDNCVLWEGMPIITESGEFMGYVGNVVFDLGTGAVRSVEVDVGIANDAIVGKRAIPASLVKGFKRGLGCEHAREPGEDDPVDETVDSGAILVGNEALSIDTVGGAAAAAGEATAKAADKARKAVAEAKPKVDDAAKTAGKAVAEMKPKVNDAAKTASKAVDKGIFALGKQLGRTSGMFAAFKEEYDKARNDE